jgi:hypothetical protein
MKHRIGQTRGRVVFALALAVAAFTLVTGVALASDPTTDTTITGNVFDITRAMTVPEHLSAVSLTGVAKTATGTFGGFSVNDPRGTGAGWNVTLHATIFDNGNASYAGKDLAAGSLTVPVMTVAKKTGSSDSGPEPEIVQEAPVAIDAALGSVKVVSAPSDGSKGMGWYDISQGGDWSLAIPTNAYIGTYTSTVTMSLTTGP